MSLRPKLCEIACGSKVQRNLFKLSKESPLAAVWFAFRPSDCLSFRASRTRPRRKGIATRVFGPPNFLKTVGTIPARKSAPPKRSQATQFPCVRGAPLCAKPMRERQSPRLSAPPSGGAVRKGKPHVHAVLKCGCWLSHAAVRKSPTGKEIVL